MLDEYLPLFPKFTKITPKLASVIQGFVSKFASYSDYNFASLFTWDVDNSCELSTLNGNLIVLFRDYISGKGFYGFIGEEQLDETTVTLLKYSQEHLQQPFLQLIPENIASKLSSSKFSVEEDRNNFDYILSVDDIAAFRTNQFRGKKNALNRFYRMYASECTTEITKLTDTLGTELIELFLTWGSSRKKDTPDYDDELNAVKRLILAKDYLKNIRIFVTRYKGECIGFVAYEYVSKTEMVLHYDKADVEYVGIFEYMKQQLTQKLQTEGIKTINYEQDLGLEGLRRSKLSWDPVDYLKKYTVKLRD